MGLASEIEEVIRQAMNEGTEEACHYVSQQQRNYHRGNVFPRRLSTFADVGENSATMRMDIAHHRTRQRISVTERREVTTFLKVEGHGR